MSSKTEGADRKIRAYVERLDALLQQCVQDLPERPDAFLWNCRRCLECIAYAWNTSKNEGFQPGNDNKKEESLLDFSRHLPKELREEWQFVLGKGNLGVHIQSTLTDYEKATRSCPEQLDNLVTWFFEQSGLWDGAPPPTVRISLDSLRQGHFPRRRDHEAELRELKEQHDSETRQQHELIASLAQQRDELTESLARAEATSATLRQQAREHEAARDQLIAQERALIEARQRNERLELELRALEREKRERWSRLDPHERAGQASGASSTPTPSPVVQNAVLPASTSPREPPRRWWLPAAGLALAAVAFAARSTLVTAQEPTPTPPGPVALAEVPPPPSASSTPPDPAPSASVPPAPHPLGCPARMVLVPAGTVTLPTPPVGWHLSTKVPGPTPVASFCIDSKLFTTKDYEACVKRGECDPLSPRTSAVCPGKSRNERPLVCTTQTEAEQFCQRARGGRLPTVLERQAAHRYESALHPENRTAEWSSDLFPVSFAATPEGSCKGGKGPCEMMFAPKVEVVAADDPGAKALDPGWNRNPVETHRADVGFRCVKDTHPLTP